jgi:tripartite-type tricarboxylate transporter receptor subunit TctC
MKRSATFPDVPAIAETLPGFDAVAWVGLFAPRGTAPEIIALLQREALKMIRVREVQSSLSTQSYEVADTGTGDFAAYVKRDYDKWVKLIARAGIKAD